MKINELVKKYNLTKEDCWQCQGNWILTHNAVEKIATQEGITFNEPDVYQTATSICLIGVANINDKKVWSTGEASPHNVKMAGKYYWAMAEKRLKDRLTLKLINASEYGIYSETEAEEFKKPNK